MGVTLQQLAVEIGCELRGDPECLIMGVGTLQNAVAGQLSFIANSRYRSYLKTTQASAVILRPQDLELCPVNVNGLVSSNPYLAYARAAQLLNPQQRPAAGVHPAAVIEPGCIVDPSASIAAHCFVGVGSRIGAGVVLGPGCVLERDVTVGANSHLVARVTLCHGVRIGANALIHPGVVIGGDGFGIANDGGRWVKVPQLGSVVIGDDVEIGANTTIDRGALEDTVIEEGVKLDNQIQVAHNVRIGAHTAIAGCAAIAGSTTIGKRCQIGGAVGIVGHLTITDDVHVTAMSLVTGNINNAGVYSSGIPVEPRAEWARNAARVRQLDEIARRLRALEKQLEKE
jgi:UDP-3-O-[3-hydroxymyristoyl] glucosamine N-acyltransferase